MWPLIVSALGGALGGSLLGGAVAKPSNTDSHNFTDSRQLDITYPVYQINTNSPGAINSTKKEATQTSTPTTTTASGTDIGQYIIPAGIICIGAIAVKEVLTK